MTCISTGRAEHLETLRRAVRDNVPRPVIITGEPGSGRTAMLSRALGFTDPERDLIVRAGPGPGGPEPAALRAAWDAAGGRRLVVAADDAHLMDHASLLALREASRNGWALTLTTCPLTTPALRPDPVSCLRHERDLLVLVLQPLSADETAAMLADVMDGPVAPPAVAALHSVTGGNPGQLRRLLTEISRASRMVRHEGQWRLRAGSPHAIRRGGPDPDVARIVEATWRAWRELAPDRADQLCRLALWHGAREAVAPVWASLLLMCGRAPEAAVFLDALPGERIRTSPPLALAKALTLAVGLGRVEEASDFLSAAAASAGRGEVLRAFRAWVLAVTGRTAQAADGLSAIERNDLDTAMFVHATRAALARAADHPAEAVFHLRRAIAAAERGSEDCPWMRPFLTASLIDSMLLSGRVRDAASVTRHFHACEPRSGWQLAVALDALLRPACQTAPVPRQVPAKSPVFAGGVRTGGV